MQLFLDRLNLEPNTIAKNKLLKVKRIQKKSQQKGRIATMYTYSGAKQY